jgi:hypothetical protein
MKQLATYRRPFAIGVLPLAAAGYLLPYQPALHWLVPAGILLALLALYGFESERRDVARQSANAATTAFYVARLVAPLIMLAAGTAGLLGFARDFDAFIENPFSSAMPQSAEFSSSNWAVFRGAGSRSMRPWLP